MELAQHYEQVEDEKDDGWYRCRHCGGKVYYKPHKPSDLAQHIPDEIYPTTDGQDGCQQRIEISEP